MAAKKKKPSSKSSLMNITLWIVQILLAGFFLFAAYPKLFTAQDLAAMMPFPVLFIQFIGAVEVLGALGLILPGIFGVKKYLTVSAAYGLTILMIGAVVTTFVTIGFTPLVLMPAVTGLLTWFVAYGRSRRA